MKTRSTIMEEIKCLLHSQTRELRDDIHNAQQRIDTFNNDILSIREVIMMNLQQENASLKQRISSLEEKVTQHTVDEERNRRREDKLEASCH